MPISLVPAGRLPPSIIRAFEGQVPPDEVGVWAAMTDEGRGRLLARLDAVLEWEVGTSSRTAEAIADGLGVSRSRFYRMLSDWRLNASLASLGARPGGPKSRGTRVRNGRANEIIQGELPGIVAASPEASVNALVERIRGSLREQGEVVPGVNAVRAMVEREKLRVARETSAGNELIMDACAVALARPDGSPYVLFACVDGGTGFVLGMALGAMDDTRGAHRNAARDALARIGKDGLGLGWVERLARAQITVGLDHADWDGFFDEARELTGSDVQAATAHPGRAMRRRLGDAVGRLRLLPMRTGGDAPLSASSAMVPDRVSFDEAVTRVEVEVLAHDRRLLADLEGEPSFPPEQLLRLLRLVAA